MQRISTKGSLYSRDTAQANKKGKRIRSRNERFIGNLVKISRMATSRDASLIESTILTLTDAVTGTENALSSKVAYSKDYNRQYLLFLIIKPGQRRREKLSYCQLLIIAGK